jgi:hypothetical protein
MWQQCHQPLLLQILFPTMFLVVIVATLLLKLSLLLSHVVALATCKCTVGDQFPLESFVLKICCMHLVLVVVHPLGHVKLFQSYSC